MAAILCSGCQDLCAGGCEVCGAVCRAPCTLCSGCCTDVCSQVARAMGSPFALYVGVTTLLNVPPLLLGLTELGELVDYGDVCQGSLWLAVNSLACVLHVVAAIYMSQRVSGSGASTILGDMEQHYYANNSSKPDRPIPNSVSGRIAHLMCYDPWMAVYILVLVAYFIWLWTGGIWTLSGKVETGCSYGVTGKVVTALGFGWAFYFCGIGALVCSVGCAMCCGRNDTTAVTTTSSTTTPYINAAAIPQGGGKANIYGSTEDSKPAATTAAKINKAEHDNLPVAHAVAY